MKKNTQPRAYALRDRTGHNAHYALVFALTADEARRDGRLDGVAYVDLVAERTPGFDDLAPPHAPPTLREKFERGWWWECDACGSPISLDGDPIDASRIVLDEVVYCSAQCQAQRASRAT